MQNYYTTQSEIETKMTELEIAIQANGKKPWTVRRVFKFISSTIGTLLCILMMIILVTVWIDRSNGETPSVFGYQIYRVETGSMIPTFPIGSVIISKEYDGTSDLEVGEVVTFSRGEQVITHRIVEIIPTESGLLYRTKGDNPENDIDRELLSKENIIAIYEWTVPFLVQTKVMPEVLYGY